MDIRIQELTTQTDALLGIRQGDITSEQAKPTINRLIHALVRHNWLYHVQAAPIISDSEYDQLFSLLQGLEEQYPDLCRADSPTQKLVGHIQEGFTKQDHGGYRLLSLKNSYNAEDLEDWNTFLVKQLGEEHYTFLVEPKFDGSSIQIMYTNGHLTQAITRGDGVVGEDITEHIKAITNLPLYIPAASTITELRLRAEVVMPKHMFAKINEEQVEEGLPIFANARNATAGTLRQLDPWMVRKRGLIVFVHDLIYRTYRDVTLQHDSEMKALLQSRGLPLFHRSQEFSTIKEVVTLCEAKKTKKYLDSEGIDFDGLVVKLNQLALREQLGTTDHHPRWAMAYKFPAEQGMTRLEDITYQVGRTGTITPVAQLTPIQLSGAMIARASLHNFDYIQKYDIRKGDMVWVQRSGEVIPYIIGPVVQQRTGDEIVVEAPHICPVCSTPLQRKESEVAWICPNTRGCVGQKKEQIKHFVSKHGMNITGLGNSLVDTLVVHGYIHGRPDIWKLTDTQTLMKLRGLPGLADKKIHQLRSELERAKEIPLGRFLYALGIPFIGRKIARMLEEHIAGLCEATIVDSIALRTYLTDTNTLQHLYGMGTQSIDSIANYFSDSFSFSLLQEAEQIGLRVIIPHQTITQQTFLTQKKIVITGTFPLSRDTLREILERKGAVVGQSVSSQTDILLVGENPGSKYTKAVSLGVTIHSLEEFSTIYNISFPASRDSHVAYSTPSLFS